ncbi:cobyric acid synthase [Butyrivibrio proteoclasticus]|uniref:cobyric acid synthase n=1 Tax=Butyrivibrio proteoclasticus TaxID=43305 RepID=UPI000478BC93|nr:cobyric acid synthase [Butyrivibrio proteoclasticus]
MAAKKLMIQGTMSGVGKSILTAGLLRVLAQDGYRVAPFKSQNMALNSFVTRDGKEMGRAQVVQAYASFKEPSSDMNPILLKPLGDSTSQVIVNGKSIGNMKAADYFRMKRELIPDIKKAFERLSAENDVVVIEGAGSPAEINLKENDIVNMGLAKMLDAPVLLVGDIDPGGVFAQLLGTVKLLPEDEVDRIKALVINKFRGDVKLLEPGLSMFGEHCDIPFAGIVPYVPLNIDEEDSISKRLRGGAGRDGLSSGELATRMDDHTNGDVLRICVIRLPYISNYTDFDNLENLEKVLFTYTDDPEVVASSDLVIIPGTKNTLGDLKWLRKKGLDKGVLDAHRKGRIVMGICGGMQILGKEICDPECLEGGGTEAGLYLLPISTSFQSDKTLKQVEKKIESLDEPFKSLSDISIRGYEIHMGKTTGLSPDSVFAASGNVLGTYVHGIFDSPEFTSALYEIACINRGIEPTKQSLDSSLSLQNKELDKLADVLRQSLDMDMVYRIIGEIK